MPAISIMVFRLWIRWQKHGSLYIDDLFVFFAGFFCLVIAVMHTLFTPYIFDIMEAQAGLVTPDAEWMKRIYLYLKMQWATIFIFWQLLWSVKFSLLLFFRRLMDGMWFFFFFGYFLYASLGNSGPLDADSNFGCRNRWNDEVVVDRGLPEHYILGISYAVPVCQLPSIFIFLQTWTRYVWHSEI